MGNPSFYCTILGKNTKSSSHVQSGEFEVGLRRREEGLRAEGEEHVGAERSGDLPGEAAAGVSRGGRGMPALPYLLPAAGAGVVRATPRGKSARSVSSYA